MTDDADPAATDGVGASVTDGVFDRVAHATPEGVLDADGFARAVDVLVATDDDLAAVVQRHGTPAFWSRPATFATMVLFILEQQVSLASGQAVFDRLRSLVGEVTPTQVAAHAESDLRAVGMTRQKAGYVAGLAHGIVDGTVDWEAATRGARTGARSALLAIRGIGPWTADVWLLACRRFPDEWPVGDRALQVGVGELRDGGPLTGDALVRAGARWRPHRSSAARLVWHAYLAERDRVETAVVGLDP